MAEVPTLLDASRGFGPAMEWQGPGGRRETENSQEANGVETAKAKWDGDWHCRTVKTLSINQSSNRWLEFQEKDGGSAS
jgi:hypothetical protein